MNNYRYRLGTSEHDKKWGSSAICGPRTWKSEGSIDPLDPVAPRPLMTRPRPTRLPRYASFTRAT